MGLLELGIWPKPPPSIFLFLRLTSIADGISLKPLVGGWNHKIKLVAKKFFPAQNHNRMKMMKNDEGQRQFTKEFWKENKQKQRWWRCAHNDTCVKNRSRYFPNKKEPRVMALNLHGYSSVWKIDSSIQVKRKRKKNCRKKDLIKNENKKQCHWLVFNLNN